MADSSQSMKCIFHDVLYGFVMYTKTGIHKS